MKRNSETPVTELQNINKKLRFTESDGESPSSGGGQIGEKRDNSGMKKKKFGFYLCTFLRDPQTRHLSFTWFFIDPSLEVLEIESCDENQKKTKKKKHLNPICDMPEDVPGGFSCVVLGSNIYTFGGVASDSGASTRCFVYDTSDTLNNRWRELAPMCSLKLSPSVVAVDGMIYVFGSRINALAPIPPSPWAEVYDPLSNTWSTVLDNPPDHTAANVEINWYYSGIVEANCALHHKSILVDVIPHGSTYYYHPFLDEWEYCTMPIHNECATSTNMVIVGDVLFMISSGSLLAYDLQKQLPEYGLSK